MTSSLVQTRVSFKYSLNVFFLVSLLPKARANLKSIARRDFNSLAMLLLLLLVGECGVRIV